MNGKYFDVVVLKRRVLTPRISEFLLGAQDGSALQPGDAGSHVELRFGGRTGRFLRHYSLIGPLVGEKAPEPFWRIAVQREDRGRGSAFIHDTFRDGTRLQLSRPQGAFRLGRNIPHTLLIAGGIGITPILPMMRSLILRNRAFEMVYAGRSRADMAYAEEVVDIGGAQAALHESDRDGNLDLAALLARQPGGTQAYICGPGPMIDALRDAARSVGWSTDYVHFEVFNAAHKADDVGMEVELADGRVVHVGAGTTILDALEGAGVQTLSDCRRGECGLCLTQILSEGAEIDHRDSFLTEAERAAGQQMCTCVSRAKPASLRLKLDIA